MLYNYNSGISEIFIRQGALLPGDIAKTTGLPFVEAMNQTTGLEFGSVVKKVLELPEYYGTPVSLHFVIVSKKHFYH